MGLLPKVSTMDSRRAIARVRTVRNNNLRRLATPRPLVYEIETQLALLALENPSALLTVRDMVHELQKSSGYLV